MYHMTNKMVHLRIPSELYAEGKEVVRHMGFGSVQELIKDALRKAVQDYRKEIALKHLAQMKGSVKGIKRLTKEERNALALEFIKMSDAERSSLFREFGLDDARKV